MRCPKCGKTIDNDSHFCEYCGTRVYNAVAADDSKLKIWEQILSFLFPIVGFVLYFHYKKFENAKAKQVVVLACVGVLAGVVANILSNL